MPITIGSLPSLTLDYTNRGPGLHAGLKQLWALLDGAQGREGFLAATVVVPGARIPVVLARADLYLLGFQCGGRWFRFDDAKWPFTDAVTQLGYDGQYASLGGLRGDLTQGAIAGIAKLADLGSRPEWKVPLRTLLVAACECARLVPVHMEILGLLNGVTSSLSLTAMAHYIQNWSKASQGTDMSREAAANLRVGFRDPTIVRR